MKSIALHPASGLLALVSLSIFAFLFATRFGIGILPDSTRYFRLGPEPYDAPLYTWLLDVLTAPGLTMSTAAWWLGLALLAANVVLIWWILSRATGSALMATFGAAFVALSPHFALGHAVAMSEPLYILLTNLTIVVLIFALQSGKGWLALVGGTLVGLTMLARFNGAALGAAAGLVFLFNSRKPLRGRLLDIALLGLTSGLVFFGWLVAAKLMAGQATGRELALLGNPDKERWLQGLHTLSVLLLPSQVPSLMRLAALGFAAAGTLALYAVFRVLPKKQSDAIDLAFARRAAACLGAYCVCYLGFIVVAAFVEANLPFNGRYALPFYVAWVMMTAILVHFAITHIQPNRVVRLAVLAAATLLLASHAARTTSNVREAYLQGTGYASTAWASSPIIAAIENLPVDAAIFSNAPDAINYLTNRNSGFIPFKFQRRTGQDRIDYPFAEQLTDLEAQLATGRAYVAILDKVNWRFFLISEQELVAELKLHAIATEADGRIYATGDMLRQAN